MIVALAVALAGFGVSLAINIGLIVYALNLAITLDDVKAEAYAREHDYTAKLVDEAIDHLQEDA